MTTSGITQSGLTRHCIDLVAAMIELSEAYLYDARLDDGLQLLTSDIVELLARELPPEEMARIQVQRAKILRFKNRLDGSRNDATLEILSEAQRTAKSLDSKSLLADVASLTGLAVYDQELWTSTLETPLRYFEQALALRKEVNDQKGVVESLFHIGTAHQNRIGRTDEDIERTFEYFQEAYALAKEGGFRREKAHVARHLGYIYGHHKGQPDRALAYHQEFLDVNEALGFKPYLPPAHTMVGFAHYQMGDPEKALKHFEAAQTIAEEIGAQQPLAEAFFGLGLVQESRGNTGAALEYYERALTVARPIHLRPVIQAATNRIEELSSEKGEAGMKPSDTLTTLFRHNLWANLRLLERCAELTNEQMDARIPGSRGSIYDTLLHIVTAEQSYFSRISTGQSHRRPREAAPMTIGDMIEAVRTTGLGLTEWASKVQAEDTVQLDWDGTPRDVPMTIILTQVINHATEHREQVKAILTQLGIEPPDLQSWSYFDELKE